MPFNSTENITCNAAGEPPVKIEWKFKSSLNDSTERFLALNSTFYEINKFNEELHAGIFICTVSNRPNSSIQRQVKLNGVANAKPELFHLPVYDFELTSGDDLQLRCGCSHCHPLIEGKWMKIGDNQMVNTELLRNSTQNRFDLMFNLKNVSRKDEGNYKCFVENRFGSDEFTVKIRLRDNRHNLNRDIKCKSVENYVPALKWSENETEYFSIRKSNNKTSNESIKADAKLFTCDYKGWNFSTFVAGEEMKS